MNTFARRQAKTHWTFAFGKSTYLIGRTGASQQDAAPASTGTPVMPGTDPQRDNTKTTTSGAWKAFALQHTRTLRRQCLK